MNNIRQKLDDKVRDWGNSTNIKISQQRGIYRRENVRLGDFLNQKTNLEKYLGIASAIATPMAVYSHWGHQPTDMTLTGYVLGLFLLNGDHPFISFGLGIVGYIPGSKLGKRIDEF